MVDSRESGRGIRTPAAARGVWAARRDQPRQGRRRTSGSAQDIVLAAGVGLGAHYGTHPALGLHVAGEQLEMGTLDVEQPNRVARALLGE
jgi:hypothetical protein